MSFLAALAFFFFFNDTATTEIYTLSLHDALPICPELVHGALDRARRVDHRNATLLERVQRVHPEDHLLERAGGDDARQDGGAAAEIFPGGRESGARSAQARDQRLVGQHPPLVAPLGEGAAEFLPVPAPPPRPGRDSHRGQSVLSPISTVNPPVANAGMSPATALNPGVARPFSMASFELHRRSASR